MSTQPEQAGLPRLEWARQAFAVAHGRFQESLQQHDRQQVWITLGETLFWISALNDTFEGLAKAKAGAIGKNAYTERRNNDRFGRAVTGLIIPRNSVVHALGDVVIERPDSADMMWQPTFANRDSLGLSQKQRQDAVRVFDASSDRPIRYQLRDANYFFVRNRVSLDEFMDELAS